MEKLTEKEMTDRAIQCGNEIAEDWKKLAEEEGCDLLTVLQSLCDKCAEANERRKMGLPVDLLEFLPAVAPENLVWNRGKPFNPHVSQRLAAQRLPVVSIDFCDAT